MRNQVKAALLKLQKSRFFYIASLCLVLFGVFFATGTLFHDNVDDTGQDVFFLLISDVTLMFVSVAFVSYFISSDFSNRTICNEIRVGYSKFSVVFSRVIIALLFAIFMQLLFFGIVILMYGLVNGFGFYIPLHKLALKLILFICQTTAVLSLAVLITFLSKKTSLSMMLSISFVFVFFNLLRNSPISNTAFYRLTIFYRFMMNNQHMSSWDISVSFISAIITILGALFTAYIVFRKAASAPRE